MRLKFLFPLIFLISLLPLSVLGDDFHKNFSDSTLRIDYIFAGGPDNVSIYLDGQTKQPGWAGRRTKLKEVPRAGSGSILVTDPSNGDTLYLNSFSSLFQEWLSTPESKTDFHSFENSFLVPLPKRETDIKVTIRNSRHQEIAGLSHRYRPDDELVGIKGNNPLPFKYIHKGGDPEKAVDIAILPEGFQAEEMDSFYYKAEKIVNEILSYHPFASVKEKFNFVAVEIPSKDTGVSIPLKKIWKDTPFGSHFSTFYSSRYLTVPRVKAMHQALEGVPYEHIIVLVNTPEYGGGGIYNSYLTVVSDNEFTLPVAVHEFGHSFGGLADEYFYEEEEEEMYPLDVEPWEPNITTLVNFDSKWKCLESGLFEGGGYKTKGIYRPAETCRMRDNYYPKFCEVCEKSLSDLIEFYTK